MKKISYRMAEINELLAHELAKLIQNLEYNDRLVTLLDVESTNDLKEAKVWISVVYFKTLPDREKNTENTSTIKKLDSQTVRYRQILGKKLSLKRIPKFNYKIDETEEKASRVEHIIDKVSSKSSLK